MFSDWSGYTGDAHLRKTSVALSVFPSVGHRIFSESFARQSDPYPGFTVIPTGFYLDKRGSGAVNQSDALILTAPIRSRLEPRDAAQLRTEELRRTPVWPSSLR